MPRKQKNKYRYFYSTNTNQLIRFNDKGDGFWFNDISNSFYSIVASMSLSYFIEDQFSTEVTLSQGLHYMKGNYVE